MRPRRGRHRAHHSATAARRPSLPCALIQSSSLCPGPGSWRPSWVIPNSTKVVTRVTHRVRLFGSEAFESDPSRSGWLSNASPSLFREHPRRVRWAVLFASALAHRRHCAASTHTARVLRTLPHRAPTDVTITTGLPVSRSVLPRAPPEDSWASTWSRTHFSGLGSYPPVSGIPGLARGGVQMFLAVCTGNVRPWPPRRRITPPPSRPHRKDCR